MFFLIWNNTDYPLTRHFHIHVFLFRAGPTYVPMNHVMVGLHLSCFSVLQFVVGDAQRP